RSSQNRSVHSVWGCARGPCSARPVRSFRSRTQRRIFPARLFAQRASSRFPDRIGNFQVASSVSIRARAANGKSMRVWNSVKERFAGAFAIRMAAACTLARMRNRNYTQLLGNERCGLAPPASCHEVANGLAQARRSFAVAQRLWKRSGITRVSNGERGDGFESGRNIENLASRVGIEAGHLVHEKSTCRGFDGEKGHGRAGVILRVAVGRFVFGEREFTNGEAQNCGILGPVDVELDKRLQRFIEVFRVIASGDDEVPRLLVTAGGSPP